MHSSSLNSFHFVLLSINSLTRQAPSQTTSLVVTSSLIWSRIKSAFSIEAFNFLVSLLFNYIQCFRSPFRISLSLDINLVFSANTSHSSISLNSFCLFITCYTFTHNGWVIFRFTTTAIRFEYTTLERVFIIYYQTAWPIVNVSPCRLILSSHNNIITASVLCTLSSTVSLVGNLFKTLKIRNVCPVLW